MTDEQKKRFAMALVRVAGDCELLAGMAAMVSEDAPAVLNDLREQVTGDDMQVVAATAHKLKGMLSTFETGGPVLELEELILSARKNKSQEVRSEFQNLEKHIEGLLSEISSLDQVNQ